jgi:hypothetical protein
MLSGLLSLGDQMLKPGSLLKVMAVSAQPLSSLPPLF